VAELEYGHEVEAGLRGRKRFFTAVGSYVLLVMLPILLLVWLLSQDPPLSGGLAGPLTPPRTQPVALPKLVTLIVQLIIIVGSARLVGLLFRQMSQPQVVGEMAAGILLGPSVFGVLLPLTFAAVFPAASLGPAIYGRWRRWSC
jgi:hypothetical protein